VITEETTSGTTLLLNDCIIFFGNKFSSADSLKRDFPNLKWAKTQQVHGNEIILSAQESEDSGRFAIADGHWTTSSNLGLCINTADCIPAFIFCENPRSVFALHAGWRGVVGRILPKALVHLKNMVKKGGGGMSAVFVALGPHIRLSSFEVDHGVRDQILSSCINSDVDDFWVESNGKSFVDLEKVLISQIKEAGISETQIYSINRDTKSNVLYHSHRRDREKAGRQISFISLK
jgi:hypothetical protein